MATELDETIAAGVTDAMKAEGAEAMRIAKLNHPNVDWQADPYTGAPLIPGSAENAADMEYNPPPPELGQGESPEPEPAPEPVKASATKTESKG